MVTKADWAAEEVDRMYMDYLGGQEAQQPDAAPPRKKLKPTLPGTGKGKGKASQAFPALSQMGSSAGPVDTPLLAPQIAVLARFICDPSAPAELLDAGYEGLKAARREIAQLSEVIGLRDDIDLVTRKRALLRVLTDRLRPLGEEGVMCSNLASDPAVQALRKGAVGSIQKFLQGFPDHFEVFSGVGKKSGLPIQFVRLPAANLDNPGKGQKAAGLSGDVRRAQEALFMRQCHEQAEYLSSYIGHSIPVHGGDGSGLLPLSVNAGGGLDLNPEQRLQVKQSLIAHIIEFLKAQPAFTAPLPEIGQDPTVKELSKGVVAKLSKLLAQHTDIFEIGFDGKQTTCTLLDGDAMPSGEDAYNPEGYDV